MGALIRIVVLTVPAGAAELAADALWAGGAHAVEERVGAEPGTVVLAADAEPAWVEPGWSVGTAEVDDGRDAWREHAQVWTAGPFTVRPPWIAATSGAGHDIVVDPGHAFGSGSHVTTRLALEALASVAAAGSSVLDVGCGSGVLAIAAALLGAGPVDGVDVDPAALEATAANAAANGVEVRCGPSLADFPGRYDVVVANITAATLVALAPEVVARVAAGGALVLTGMLVDQADEVAAAHVALAEVARAEAEGWSVLTLRAPSVA